MVHHLENRRNDTEAGQPFHIVIGEDQNRSSATRGTEVDAPRVAVTVVLNEVYRKGIIHSRQVEPGIPHVGISVVHDYDLPDDRMVGMPFE
jgi:hypothetical protein